MTTTVFQILGSLALFLLAMEMMTDGLKNAAGRHLRHLLGSWTKTPLRGFASGIVVTGIVQSSSAVTVATIGFVNAGVLPMSHSLGVIIGANVGTTMTGWLVNLVGAGVKIEALAMPMLAVGVAIKLLRRDHHQRFIGEAITGFALFFLALSLMKSSLEAFAGGLDNPEILDGSYSLPLFILFGFMMTVLMQSSSAALAVIISAAAGNLLALDNAASAVIGANLGTTSTAAMAALSATANARRLAVGHVLFNLGTALIALAILPLMLWLVANLTTWLKLGTNVAVSLALFHTLFNLLGALIMLPLTPYLARFLGRLFRSKEEDNATPRHLDYTLVATPELAVAAVDEEMKRLTGLIRGLLRVCLDREDLKPTQIQPKADACRNLNTAIVDYVSRVRAEKMQPSTVDALTLSIRTCRYLMEATDLAAELLKLKKAEDQPGMARLSETLERYIDTLRTLVAADDPLPPTVEEAENIYHQLKSELLAMIVRREIPTTDGESALDTLSSVRRLVDQWNKALAWRPVSRLVDGDPEPALSNPQ